MRDWEREDGSIEREMGLSVFIADERSPDELATSQFSRCYGIVELQVGTIRALGPSLGLALDVVRDRDPEAPRGHALVMGLPHPSDDPAKAERVATLLVELAGELVWKRAPGKKAGP